MATCFIYRFSSIKLPPFGNHQLTEHSIFHPPCSSLWTHLLPDRDGCRYVSFRLGDYFKKEVYSFFVMLEK